MASPYKDANGTELDLGDHVRFDTGWFIYTLIMVSLDGNNGLITDGERAIWRPLKRLVWCK